MLEDAITGSRISQLPFADEFQAQRARLNPSEDAAITEEIQSRLDAILVGKAISASWVPGTDWTGTVFEPIYTQVCAGQFEESARFYGKFFMLVVIEHHSLWRKIKQPKYKSAPNDIEITLYWRVD